MAPGSLAIVGGCRAIASARMFAFSLAVTAFAFAALRFRRWALGVMEPAAASVTIPALAAGALCRR